MDSGDTARGRLHALGQGARNALEILRRGRFGAPYAAAYEVAAREGILRLRHYRRAEGAPALDVGPLLLVPPLMVTAEVYDISPELSAVAWLADAGVDVWVVDFGAPEDEEGGFARTLDDHVTAVDRAIGEVAARTGRSVHLAGYSQGGMFAYQAAGYRRGRDLASVITFGSPVDMRRNLPIRLHDTLAERVLAAAREALDEALDEIRALPGALTSAGFKILSPRQEVRYLLRTLGLLHDREALARAEPRRRFLGGEGFIAWPGPALRGFIDQFVVENRMRSGGYVIRGRAASLADVAVPILFFVGSRDDLARPEAVRAIRAAAPRAECWEARVRTGHFGLVVGSRALGVTWPTVVAWILWREGRGPRPEALAADDALAPPPGPLPPEGDPAARAGVLGRLGGLAAGAADGAWRRLGDVSLEVTGLLGALRWQLPRLARLLAIDDRTRVSLGRLLAEQAAATPDEECLLWEGRAYTYAEADARVTRLARALAEAGVAPGEHVGVLMGNHPDLLTSVAALSRLGAVAVVLNAEARGASLRHAAAAGSVRRLLVDPAHAAAPAEAGIDAPRLGLRAGQPADALPAGVLDLDARAEAAPAALPAGLRADPGRGADLALLLFTSGTTGHPKAARITNRRQVAAALWAAAICEMTPRRTVYLALPLHHATGLLAGAGAALAAGARLALAPRFSVHAFWPDVRRYGADVVFYVGEMLRYLTLAPREPDEGHHPVRLFAGNGLRPEVWRALQDRFGPVRVVEFYASTEGNAVLANATGEKVGSVGRPVTGAGELVAVRFDVEAGELLRGADGRPLPCVTDEPGLLLARIDDEHPLARFDGYADEEHTEARVHRDLFAPGDAWFDTGDLLRRDADGDWWFVDRVGDTFRWKGENVSTAQVEQVLAALPWVAAAAVYGVPLPGREGRAGMAALVLTAGAAFDGEALFRAVARDLTPAARPRFVRAVPELETTRSLKVVKTRLQAEGADPGRLPDPLWWYDAEGGAYAPLDMATYARLTREA